MEAYFPTLDDLIMGCGQHFLESLRLPPPERAAEIFGGAASEPERVRRLVDTIFDAYEREGVGLEAGRRERAQLPLVDEWLEQLDLSLDALVAEALRPRPDPSSIASVQALTDVTMWRALRDQERFAGRLRAAGEHHGRAVAGGAPHTGVSSVSPSFGAAREPALLGPWAWLQ